MDLLAAHQKTAAELPVIVMSAQKTVWTAGGAHPERGAYEYRPSLRPQGADRDRRFRALSEAEGGHAPGAEARGPTEVRYRWVGTLAGDGREISPRAG